jgi:hypothetical protein
MIKSLQADGKTLSSRLNAALTAGIGAFGPRNPPYDIRQSPTGEMRCCP